MQDDAANFSGTAVSNRRRSQRVFLQVRVVARFHLLQREWIVEGESSVVNAHGGTIQLSVAPMAPGDIITLTNPDTLQSESCRVIRIEALSDQGFEVSFAFDRPAPNFLGHRLPTHRLDRVHPHPRLRWSPCRGAARCAPGPHDVIR